MKIEPNMYVRTDRGNIFKVENVFEIDVDGTWFKSKVKENSVIKDLPRFMYDEEDEIINKASHNIIDLIEEGDIIEYENYTILSDLPVGIPLVTRIITDSEIQDLKDFIKKKKVRLTGVVTKEQFEAMQYKVV